MIKWIALVSIVVVTTSVAQGQGVRYGAIKSAEVGARVATEAKAAEALRLKRGDVVEVVSTRGKVAEIRPAGGFSVYTSETWKGQAALRIDDKGRAIVAASDLPMYIAPQATSARLGNFRRNASLRVLGRKAGGWVEVLAPRGTSLFVDANAIDSSADQASLAQRFAARVGEGEAVGGARRVSVVEAGDAEAGARQSLRDLEKRYDMALKGPDSAAGLAQLRAEYESLARKVGPESDVGRAASSRATHLRRRERIASSIENANRRLAHLEGEIGEAEAGYEETLIRMRRERRERIEKGLTRTPRPEPKSRFLQHSIGRIYPDFGETVTQDRGVFILTKAGERRYRLISDRYDLAEYQDKTIGVTKWTILDDGANSPWPKVLVERLEILR